MKNRTALTTIILLTLGLNAFGQEERVLTGNQWAKQEVKNSLSNTTEKQILADTLIRDNETAKGVAEAILFNIYGKENIIRQRPYKVYLVDGYWVLNGILPKGWVGGTFEIIIRATDGKVIKMIHGK